MNFKKFSIVLLTMLYTKLLIALSGSNQMKSIAQSACKVTRNLTNQQPHTQDILIGNLGGITELKISNELIRCIGHNNPVVVADLIAKLDRENLRKASVVVLIMKRISLVRKMSVD